mgnify:CR=1 FL=1
MSVTVLLADDHPIVRQGLRRLLEAEADFKIVGEASDGLQAVQMAERFKPDILVVDMMMPGMNGMEVLRQLSKISPATRAIVLSMQSSDAYVVEALKCGACGYVLKDTGPSELVQAVRAVYQGKRYLSPALSERLIQAFIQTAQELPPDPFDSLTSREREVLQLSAEGNTAAQIAQKLSISPRTAELHRTNLMKKLNLNSQKDLIRFAIKRGILPLDD